MNCMKHTGVHGRRFHAPAFRNIHTEFCTAIRHQLLSRRQRNDCPAVLYRCCCAGGCLLTLFFIRCSHSCYASWPFKYHLCIGICQHQHTILQRIEICHILHGNTAVIPGQIIDRPVIIHGSGTVLQEIQSHGSSHLFQILLADSHTVIGHAHKLPCSCRSVCGSSRYSIHCGIRAHI